MKSARLPKVIDLLQRTGCTSTDIACSVYCTERSAQQMIKKLRQSGTVYIQEWKRSGHILVAVYRYGIGADAVKPPPLTPMERLRVWRQRESLDDKAFRLARERGKRLKPRRDPLVAMFYGDGNSSDAG
jgi:hypothetical protein